MNKKIKLSDLKLKSFITNESKLAGKTVKGGGGTDFTDTGSHITYLPWVGGCTGPAGC